MKRNIKKLLFILVILFLLIICPDKTNALSGQTSYINVNDNSESLIIDDLKILNISFKDNSLDSSLSFGLTGKTINNLDETFEYKALVYYYDENYNLITDGYFSEIITPGTSDFILMSNLSVLNNHNVKEISYYRLEISVTETLKEEDFTPSKNSLYKTLDYVIDKYDINIILNENNTLDITETITAYFNVPKHGIYRLIPLKNTVNRLDGTVSKNKAQISNLKVNDEYQTSKENDNYKIQIGSQYQTLTGENTYVIKYTYNLGKDPNKDYDELYFNIIGSNWDTVIGNVTFTIVMPKDFDSSKLGFSSGKLGSVDNSKVIYNVQENTIKGSYNGILDKGEALTIRCELDEGYFVGAGLNINIKDYLGIILPIIFLGISILIWYFFGKDKPVIETVEFYPPEGFNSLEVGFLYKGIADSGDVTSLLIYLANKGYIKISETEEKSLFSSVKGFKITKLKDYDGNNLNEHLFLNGLFKKKTPILKEEDSNLSEFTNLKDLFKNLPKYVKETEFVESSLNEVTSTDLYDNFYTTVNKILLNINSKENKDKIWEKGKLRKRIFIILLIIATYFLITAQPLFNYGKMNNLLFAIVFPAAGFTFMFCMLFSNNETIYVNGTIKKFLILPKIFSFVWGALFAGIPWTFLLFPALKQEPIYLIAYIVGLICIFGMMLCFRFLAQRTAYGNEILGKIKGFKNFLETAEKDKLEALVNENPTYFYDILPYTYVLGVSDTWIKKFETINLKAPTWYDSSTSFDMITFSSFMNNTMISAQSVMASSSSSSSSGGSSDGGSSGGGSSGGGSGGGGGGSW